MLQKLNLNALQADLSNVNRLLDARTEETDPIGFYQLTGRKNELLAKINEIQANPEKSALISLFFGGAPVIGSKGINADFAGKAIESFQDLISKRFASLEFGTLGQRGPIPLRSNTDLMLTDVARGSFGLVLEEVSQNVSLTDTSLKGIVDEVTKTIIDFSSQNEDVFETALSEIDSRTLISLRDFFKLLDDQRATIRLVEGDTDENLDSSAIHLARQRTDFTEIEEKITDEVIGRLFILPAHKRFELQKIDSPETLYGSISAEFSKESLSGLQRNTDTLGKVWKTRMRIRETFRPNQQTKVSYTLMGLVERLDQY